MKKYYGTIFHNEKFSIFVMSLRRHYILLMKVFGFYPLSEIW